jgi:hypothetical protein
VSSGRRRSINLASSGTALLDRSRLLVTYRPSAAFRRASMGVITVDKSDSSGYPDRRIYAESTRWT